MQFALACRVHTDRRVYLFRDKVIARLLDVVRIRMVTALGTRLAVILHNQTKYLLFDLRFQDRSFAK